jgi:polysaccharide biosynthesis/export protein
VASRMAKNLITSYLSCISIFLQSREDHMTRTRRQMCEGRTFPRIDTSRRRRESRSSYCFLPFLIFAALACVGCQTQQPPLPNPPGPHTAVRLSPGDVIKAAYADESIPDQTQKIRRDGKVSLPLIGEVQAAGKRIIDFQHQLISRYESDLDDPEVLVTLENGTASVIVSGFANKPGKVEFDRPKTVYQAIMEAGGVSDYGSASNVHLTRIINGQQRTEIINLRAAIRGEPTQPKYVQDGDVIYVARSWF